MHSALDYTVFVNTEQFYSLIKDTLPTKRQRRHRTWKC